MMTHANNVLTMNGAEPAIDSDAYPSDFTQLDDEEGGGWLVSYPDLPGCHAYGRTKAEAMVLGGEAVKLWIKVSLERGLTVPQPNEHESRSGYVRIRLPKALHKYISVISAGMNTSLNAFVVDTLGDTMKLVWGDGTGSGKTQENYRSKLGEWRQQSDYSFGEFSVADHARFSGEWTQRLASQLHHELRYRAEEQGVSLNTLIIFLLSTGVAHRQATMENPIKSQKKQVAA